MPLSFAPTGSTGGLGGSFPNPGIPFSGAINSVAHQSSGVLTLDYHDGDVHVVTVSANITGFSIQNLSVSGRHRRMLVYLVSDATYSVSFSGIYASNSVPPYTTENGGEDVFMFFCRGDGKVRVATSGLNYLEVP